MSLGETHSFLLDEVARYLNAKTVREVLTQAFLAAPMFNVRWRWNATISLAFPRFRGGKKVPPQLQRIQAEDLVAVVFPDQIACVENVPGEREIPEHPLVEQTIRDGLDEAMDIGGLEKLLTNLHSGKIRVVTCELTEPSPLAQEILNAKPYAFLDDVPLEERRTQAVMSRRWLDPEAAADIGKLDVSAIERVRHEAWPEAQSPDELHDALMVLGFITETEGCRQSWTTHLESLNQPRQGHPCPASGIARSLGGDGTLGRACNGVCGHHPATAGSHTTGIRAPSTVTRGGVDRVATRPPERSRPDRGRRGWSRRRLGQYRIWSKR